MNNNGAEFYLITAASTLKALEFNEDGTTKKLLIENFLLEARTNAAEILIASFQGLFGLTNEEINHNYLEIVGLKISEMLPDFVKKHCLISSTDSHIEELQMVLEGEVVMASLEEM
jgi:hypothetical protein